MMASRYAFLNIHGLTSKIEEMRLILTERNFSVLCLSETFLSSYDSDNIYAVPYYRMIRRDRGYGCGGGLIVYIHNSVAYEHLENLDSSMPESVNIKVKPNMKKGFILSFLYRPPNSTSSWYDKVYEYFENCFSLNNEIIILGDFNINLLEAEGKNKRWMNMVTSFSLNQLISCPTRVTDTSSTLIDHVYSNNPSNIAESGVVKYTLSDHFLIFATRLCTPTKKKESKRICREFKDYSLLTDQNIRDNLSGNNLESVLCEKNIDSMFYKFNQIYCSLMKSLIITRKRFVKTDNLPKWLDNEVKKHMKLRDYLKRDGKWKEYKKRRNFVTNLIKRKKKKAISEIINSNRNNTKPLWDALNISSNKDRSLINNTKLTPNDFNRHFTSIAKSISKNIPTKDLVQAEERPYTTLRLSHWSPFTPEICHKYLKTISDKKATGQDGISIKVLKRTWPYISNIVCDMFNRILIENEVPNSWKIARVTPIHKGGDLNDPSNYRPISILPVLSKVFEKHVNQQLQNYFSSNSLIHKLQCGFRKSYSCADLVHKIVTDCIGAKSEGHYVSLMFLDFKKAFDCVDHTILVKKLRLFGITGKPLSLVNSFLSNRSQFVMIHKDKSEILPIQIGVPQGSILAPTLFLIYINDLLSYTLHSKSFAYADDTVFMSKSEDIRSLNQICDIDLILINRWCNNNRMILNTKKSHYMILKPTSRASGSDLYLNINDTRLQRVKKTKLLGFVLNDKLTWSDHVDYICKNVKKSLALFQNCREFLDRKSSRNFYYQYIFCHLIYGIRIYGNLAPHYLLNNLFLLQKRAFRLIANVNHIPYHLISTIDLYKSLDLVPFPSLVGQFTCLFGFHILHSLCPDFLIADFQHHQTRKSCRDTHILQYNSNMLNHRIITSFNALPIHLRYAAKLITFKHLLHIYYKLL